MQTGSGIKDYTVLPLVLLFRFVLLNKNKSELKIRTLPVGRQEFCSGEGKFLALSQVGLQRAWVPLSQKEMFCVPAWLGALSLELLWVHKRPKAVVVDRGAATCISAL